MISRALSLILSATVIIASNFSLLPINTTVLPSDAYLLISSLDKSNELPSIKDSLAA